MKKNKGFTLVELLGVISIMGVVIVLFIPTLLTALRNGKKMLSEYDLAGLEDAGKMYITDFDTGINTYTYTGTEDYVLANGNVIKPNTELTPYQFKLYLISLGGSIDVTTETLVAEGYYDKACKYAKEPGKKDENCKMPKTCTISAGIEHTMSKDGAYYITTDYVAEVKGGCE